MNLPLLLKCDITKESVAANWHHEVASYTYWPFEIEFSSYAIHICYVATSYTLAIQLTCYN